MFGLTSSRRVRDLENRLVQLEARQLELARLPMEWEDWFEKFKSLYARLNKRASRDEARAETPTEAPPLNPRALALLNPYQRNGG